LQGFQSVLQDVLIINTLTFLVDFVWRCVCVCVCESVFELTVGYVPSRRLPAMTWAISWLRTMAIPSESCIASRMPIRTRKIHVLEVSCLKEIHKNMNKKSFLLSLSLSLYLYLYLYLYLSLSLTLHLSQSNVPSKTKTVSAPKTKALGSFALIK
jgi:hypothetical protein